MDKKLSEYTLGEMQKICCGPQFCEECIFFNRICRTGAIIQPTDFMLSDKIFFTGEEIETAKALAKCFGLSAEISRPCKSENVRIHGTEAYMCDDAFPSLNGVDTFILRLGTIIGNKGLSYD